MDFQKSIVFVIGISFFSSIASAAGISDEAQTEILESLRDYVPLPTKSKLSQNQAEQEEEYCKSYDYKRGQNCLEKRYMKDGYYLIDIAFENDGSVPEQPRSRHIRGTEPSSRDTIKRDLFLAEWSDPLFRKYIGDDYYKFNSIELKAVNSRAVIVELRISDADELADLLSDSRIIHIRHVASPEPELEEIVN